MKKLILFIILIVLVLAGIKLIKNKNDELANESFAVKPIFTVNVVKAKSKIVEERSTFIAKLESTLAPKISTKVAAYIKKVHVVENQEVKKGDLLISIDSKEIEKSLIQIKNSIKSIQLSIDSMNANVSSLRNETKASKSKLDRNKILYKVGGLSKEKFENSEVEYQLKKAKVDSTLKSIEAKTYELKAIENSYDSKKASLEYYNIKSPINGIVDSIMLKTGDMALAGKTILTLLSKEQKLTFTFSNSEIKKDLEVIVNNDSNNNVKTKISKILKSSDKFLYQAQIDLNTYLDLAIGSFVNIEVITKKQEAKALPINTILHRKDGTYVVLYEEDENKNAKFSFKKVEVLVQSEDYVITNPVIEQSVALASESKLVILPSSNNYTIVEK
ncbi:efflux RND transporter periplasmic adaptor subunit [Poseidonibacter ostreae]|jgi:RND family efflux transporter MFP subunit|uniref:Biotin/lipoyl-binding protein n=1 Tax=Poseidonibacter ostreae TaxID=2654171 RepID=A0A6L4WV51_9BACT|nr:biotin/lipoyl-binding protein [Poseidonibacter ostreae]KAB7886523.1 biotin/lipoyl-binding protein [Poseidonibacter ostreae]KAB7890628.1 biotin/lipoyl-binding protein [Poseidonibacter ostreae]KAB7892388.1 biotin/lipoyl-binding protein [Poseidonibacter ostreae]MAD42266.1 hypothetical protein [Arcobacter sp.]|tara:strand:+ start:4548 stop:5711 length:1164 start_codon:yes stop_codon:yes gene_type:complete